MPKKKVIKHTPGGTINPKVLKVNTIKKRIKKKIRNEWFKSCINQTFRRIHRNGKTTTRRRRQQQQQQQRRRTIKQQQQHLY